MKLVDVRKSVMAVDADLRSDEEALLLENGSAQADLWGINIRPSQGSCSRGVDDSAIWARIVDVVDSRVRE